MSIESIPLDVLLLIFKKLDLRSVARCIQVSKRLHSYRNKQLLLNLLSSRFKSIECDSYSTLITQYECFVKSKWIITAKDERHNAIGIAILKPLKDYDRVYYLAEYKRGSEIEDDKPFLWLENHAYYRDKGTGEIKSGKRFTSIGPIKSSIPFPKRSIRKVDDYILFDFENISLSRNMEKIREYLSNFMYFERLVPNIEYRSTSLRVINYRPYGKVWKQQTFGYGDSSEEVDEDRVLLNPSKPLVIMSSGRGNRLVYLLHNGGRIALNGTFRSEYNNKNIAPCVEAISNHLNIIDMVNLCSTCKGLRKFVTGDRWKFYLQRHEFVQEKEIDGSKIDWNTPEYKVRLHNGKIYGLYLKRRGQKWDPSNGKIAFIDYTPRMIVESNMLRSLSDLYFACTVFKMDCRMTSAERGKKSVIRKIPSYVFTFDIGIGQDIDVAIRDFGEDIVFEPEILELFDKYSPMDYISQRAWTTEPWPDDYFTDESSSSD